MTEQISDLDLKDNYSPKKTQQQIEQWRDKAGEIKDTLDQAVFDGDERLREARDYAFSTYKALNKIYQKMGKK